ncbi:hypothetical protein [Kocuria cellulosilytica]|uniref:hypothetical protein n=1 Tax=Kocuria cellulosilytica TaxID=3071451 RepID=UPI0034D63D56
MPEQKMERHYPKVAALRPRTEGDVPEAGQRQLYLARTVMAEAAEAEAARRAPRNPRLVSSTHGEIGRMLLAIPSYAVTDVDGRPNPLAAAYRDLLSKLGPEVDLEVITHESVESDVRAWFEADRPGDVHVITVADHLHFSVWAEDGYAIVQDEGAGTPAFVEPFSFPRYADALLADIVSNHTDMGHTQAPLYFQGGNLLIGDDFFLIGADYPANSLGYVYQAIIPAPGESPPATVRRLYSEYLDKSRVMHYVGSTVPVPAQAVRPITVDGAEWQEIVHFGNKAGTVQPLFHIDMFITLAGRGADGRYRLLVGDPRMAAQILDVPLWPGAMQEVFDNIALHLETLGFDVHRNPLPLTHVDDPADRLRTWYFATGNNALTQIGSDGTKRVWLPTYGHGAWSDLARTDEANRDVWQSLGFEVTMLGDFHPFAENLGAVHCIKKYLDRTDGQGRLPT